MTTHAWNCRNALRMIQGFPPFSRDGKQGVCVCVLPWCVSWAGAGVFIPERQSLWPTIGCQSSCGHISSSHPVEYHRTCIRINSCREYYVHKRSLQVKENQWISLRVMSTKVICLCTAQKNGTIAKTNSHFTLYLHLSIQCSYLLLFKSSKSV